PAGRVGGGRPIALVGGTGSLRGWCALRHTRRPLRRHHAGHRDRGLGADPPARHQGSEVVTRPGAMLPTLAGGTRKAPTSAVLTLLGGPPSIPRRGRRQTNPPEIAGSPPAAPARRGVRP